MDAGKCAQKPFVRFLATLATAAKGQAGNHANIQKTSRGHQENSLSFRTAMLKLSVTTPDKRKARASHALTAVWLG